MSFLDPKVLTFRLAGPCFDDRTLSFSRAACSTYKELYGTTSRWFAFRFLLE